MKTKELLETYYRGLAQKMGWESVLAEDFKFVGGDMLKTEPIVGKNEYIKVIDRFGKLFTTARTREMFIDGEQAFVRANYDYVFPGGKKISADVAELWKAKDGKLDSLTIFFDTAGFQTLLKP